jgi:uncharacterized protein YndB with AHSA1/START domain
MTEQAIDLTVRKTITVEAPREYAFAVFTEQMGSWWPLDTKSIGSAEARTAVLDPREGGRWYERGVDGSECEWGQVITYDAPERLVLDWQIGADWRYDPDVHSEVEVRFIADGETRTRVELEHRGLAKAFGDRAEQMHAIFDSADGWGDILGRYRQAASS